MFSIKRTRSHELETLSKAYLLRFFSKWVCNEYNPDYGLDYKITIVENGEVTKDFFFVQNKATDNIDIKENEIYFVLDVKHILSFIEIPIPVLLILYDAQNDCSYWLNLQRYYKEVLINEEKDWSKQKTKTLKIPLKNRLIDLNIIKEMIITSSKELFRSITFGYKWFEGHERVLEFPEEVDKIIKKYESDFIQSNIFASLLNFRKDDMEKTQEHLEIVYKQKKENLTHLQIILSIFLCELPILGINPKKLIDLLNEGLELAIKLKNNVFEKLFRFFLNYSEVFELFIEKLPLIIQKNYIAEEKSNIDSFVQFIWDNQDLYLTGLLNTKINIMFQILKEVLEDGNIIEYIELQLCIIFLDNFVFGIIKKSTGKGIIKRDHKQIEFINQLLSMIEKIGNTDLLLQAYLLIGGYFEQFNLKECKSLYNKGLELAKQNNHVYYIKKFEYNIQEAGKPIEIPTLKEQREEIRNMPLKSFIEIQEFKYRNLESIEDEELKSILKFAQKEMYVLNILKFCENLNICYIPSSLGQVYGIFSLGVKTIACLIKKKRYESANLMDTIEHFKKNICHGCELRKPRDQNYNPPTKILDQMCDKIGKMIKKNSSKA